MEGLIVCPHCGKGCKSDGGLKQHISRSRNCNLAQKTMLVASRSLRTPTNQQASQSIHYQERFGTGTRRSSRVRNRDNDVTVSDAVPANPWALPNHPEAIEVTNPVADAPDSEDDAADLGHNDDESGAADEESAVSEAEEEEEEEEDCMSPNTDMLRAFQKCCSDQSDTWAPLSPAEETSIRLLATLKKKKTPLNAFPELLEWHLRETKHLQPHETLGDTKDYVHRKTLLKRLMKRYNLEPMIPKLKRLTLPFSRATVAIPHRDAKDCIVSLLTDPRAKDKHYLFYDKNPVLPHPMRSFF